MSHDDQRVWTAAFRLSQYTSEREFTCWELRIPMNLVQSVLLKGRSRSLLGFYRPMRMLCVHRATDPNFRATAGSIFRSLLTPRTCARVAGANKSKVLTINIGPVYRAETGRAARYAATRDREFRRSFARPPNCSRHRHKSALCASSKTSICARWTSCAFLFANV